MNRSELRARVRSLTNIYSTALLSDADINDALNEAYFEVCDTFEWPQFVATETIAVEAGTDSYELPEGFSRALALSNRQSGQVNRRLTPITVFDDEAFTDECSVPLYYRVDGSSGEVVLAPAPVADETLTLVYTIAPTPLGDDDDAPVFDESFQAVLAYVAAVQLLSDRRGDKQKIEALASTANRYVDRMRRHHIIASDHAPVRAGAFRWRGRGGKWHA